MKSSRPRAGLKRLQESRIGGVDIREIAACTCLTLRRSTRVATQLFDAHVGKAGLTIGQFGVLAQLYGVGVWRRSIAVKDLADLIETDATTLLRTLGPLEKNGWIASERDPEDRRSRLLWLTDKGKAKLADATPHWETAQRELRQRVGGETIVALNGLLDLAGKKLHPD